MRITLEQALSLIETHTTPLAAEALPLSRALGRVLQQNICAPIFQPPFPRSPLDGYALRAEDSAGASRETPRLLRVVDRSFAGVPAVHSVAAGEAVRIMTGAPIPEGADCVIRQEDTNYGEESVELYASLRPYDNYCFAGEDYRAGNCLVPAGLRLSAALCAVLSGAGICSAKVNGLPRVAVLSTGSELQPAGEPLEYGKIYDANAGYLENRLAELHIPQVHCYRSVDHADTLKDAFASALAQHDLVISTGGVSVGQADLVPEVLESLGGTKVFHGVHIKPGMPAALYLVSGKPVLALSGNPFACVVSFELLGRKLLAALSGDKMLLPVCETVTLQNSFEKARPVRRFLCGHIDTDHTIFLSPAQQNSKTHMLVGSNCIVELPAGSEALPAGAQVTAYRF